MLLSKNALSSEFDTIFVDFILKTLKNIKSIF